MGKLVEAPRAVLRRQTISDYRVFTPRLVEEVARLARRLGTLSVLHINSTLSGGGVAELLRSQVPLERSLGIISRWFFISAPRDFFKVTKKLHNLLQGKPGMLAKEEQQTYKRAARDLAGSLRGILRKAASTKTVVILHDPQTLPLINAIPREIPVIVRLHIDLSSPNRRALRFIHPLLRKARYVVISHRAYHLWRDERLKIRVMAPAIDPFTAKNRELSPPRALRILFDNGLNINKPILAQVSRFDPWKDPLGAIKTYGLAKNKIPALQLILAGKYAADDPEGAAIFEAVSKHARGDPDIFLFTEHDDTFINAVQRASDVILQKSLREGFGLTVTEAMWKGKAVVGGKTAGIGLQIRNGKNGFFASSPEEAARAVVHLLRDERLRTKIGKAARETVRREFLFARLMRDHLKLYQEVYE
ncbi:MAG: glycosyltransferase [Candidatus Sungbacteria bacterium]|nr:glycosyltransferase [Candidatus Sungbacteria bacterium]